MTAPDRAERRDEVRENEERLRLAIESTGIGTWDMNAETGRGRWSKEFRAICGLPAETPSTLRTFAGLIHPEDRAAAEVQFAHACGARDSGSQAAEFRIRRFDDGTERWVLLKGRVWFDPQGAPARAIGTLLDITDQKRTAEALAESEERYRLAVTAFHGATYETDLETGYAYRAARAYEMVGLRPEAGEPTRTWWFSRIHPDDAPRFHAALEELLAGRANELDLEFRVRHENGSWVWVWQRGLAVRDARGKLTRTVGALLDITTRKRAEAALRESEARFRHMADSAPALIWMTDESAQVTFANMHFDHLFGRPAAEMLGTGWRKVIHPEDVEEYSSAGLRAFNERQPFRIEVRALDKHGAVRWLRCEAVARLDDAGAFLGYTGCAVDITDAKAAEDRRALLVHELNHRVKNTLATVQSIAAQTLRNAESIDAAKQAFEERLMALSRVHDVLTRENWEGAALGDIVAQAVEPYRGHGEQAFETAGPYVRLSTPLALAFAMALQELVTNAVKYGALSTQTGRVRIDWDATTADGQAARVNLQWAEAGGPPVRKPRRRGFGSRMIERSFGDHPQASVELVFAPTGVVCTFTAPLGEPSAAGET